VRIAYGYPSPEMMDAAERGEIELGGCIIEEGAPGRRCRRCGQAPGLEMAWTGIDGPRSGEFAFAHRVLVPSGVPAPNATDPELLEFALSFDGYEAFGSDELFALSRKARTAYEKRGTVPANIAVLRGCLFFEQRIARANNATLRTPYVRALLEAIGTESRNLEEIP
jgi:hypothetical protein